jgi:hypothetical protein
MISCPVEISADDFLERARTPFGVSCEQIPVWFDLQDCQCLLNAQIGEKTRGKVINAMEKEFLSDRASLVVVSTASFAC